MLYDKKTYFENHYHQNKFCQENNLNQTIEVLQFYLAFVLILFLLLMFQVLNFLRFKKY